MHFASEMRIPALAPEWNSVNGIQTAWAIRASAHCPLFPQAGKPEQQAG
jgi:hypothetical protein